MNRMLVLHATWREDHLLHVWSEVETDGRGRVPDGTHPFAAKAAEVRETLGGLLPPSLTGTLKDLADGSVPLALPTKAGRPLPSDERLDDDTPDGQDQPARMAPWTVPGVSAPAGSAAEWLVGLPRKGEEPPGVVIGDDVRWFIAASRLALDLIVRERYVPSAEGKWEPVLSAPGVFERCRHLALAMPDGCRAQPTGPNFQTRSAVLRSFLRDAVDGFVRNRHEPDATAPWSLGRWLEALGPGNAPRHGTGAHPVPVQVPADVGALVTAWSGPAMTLEPYEGARTCFSLEPPHHERRRGRGRRGPPASPEWQLRFLLEPVGHPEKAMPAAILWRNQVPIPPNRRPAAQDRLLADLVRANREFPPLTRALQEKLPRSVTLSVHEAYTFLTTVAPLLTESGTALQIPEELVNGRSRIGVQVKLKPGAGAEGFAAPVNVEYSLSAGDVPLSQQELQALIEARLPLVQIKGRWVELRPGDIKAAAEILNGKPVSKPLAEALFGAWGEGETDGLPVMGVSADGWLQKLLGSDDTRLELVPVPKEFNGTLRPYQIRGLSWLDFLRRLGAGACLADDMGLGKAQPLDAKILTPSGWRLMGSLKVGDQVTGSDGKPTRVTGVFPQGVRDVFRVTFNDGASTRCCDEHLWNVNSAVRRKRGRPYQTLPLSAIRTTMTDGAGNRRHYIPMVEPVAFPRRDLPLDPYLLGVLLGDGSIRHSSVQFSTTDPDLVREVERLIPRGVRVRFRSRCDYGIVSPRSGVANPVRRKLNDLGLAGHGSDDKFIPPAYLLGSIDQRISLLQGLLDTDGYVSRDGVVQFSSNSPWLADGVAELVMSLGGNVRRTSKISASGKRHYLLTICLPAGTCPFRIARKASRYFPRAKYGPTRGFASVKPIGRMPVQCIRVAASNQQYVTDDYVVTHNTPQSLALLLRHAKDHPQTDDDRRPSLVVAPTSVIGNWEREAMKFAPDLKLHLHDGPNRAKGAKFAKAIAKADLVVTSYALLNIDKELLTATPWDTVLLDEAQNIKNPHARQSAAARGLNSRYRIAMTGTPVENRLSELWSIFEFLNPGYLGSLETFRSTLANPIERAHSKGHADRLRKLVQPFMLRRVKTDPGIAPELPEKIETTETCRLTREQAQLYETVVKEMMRKIEDTDGIERKGHVLATLTKLKQVCNHPAQFAKDGSRLPGRSGKLQRLDDLLEEIVEEGQRALVFTQYAEMANLLNRHLTKTLEADVLMLTGSTSREEREELIAEFQDEEDGPKVFILSLKAGGTGLNLTAASHVLHYDRWWNPAVEAQATDRAYRIGQDKTVHVHAFVTAGTIEERVAAMLESKKSLAGKIVGTGEDWITELSTANLKDLFMLRAESLAEDE